MTRSKTKQFEVGERRYSHPAAGSFVSWGTREQCILDLKNHYHIVPCEEDVIEEDTRKTVQEVMYEIHRREKKTWDEYVSSSVAINSAMSAITKWPSKYRSTAVYVVTGGSEGYYLHVELNGVMNDDGTSEDGKTMIIAKSLGATWRQCWASAGRIARMLGA